MITRISLPSILYLSLTVAAVFAPSAHALDNNVALEDLSGSKGEEILETFEVPEGTERLTIRTFGGSGDSDLYVRFGAEPTLREFDCRPYKNGNYETCVSNSPAAGTYYILVRSYRDFSGVTLVASHGGADEPSDSGPGSAANPIVLENGVALSALDGGQYSRRYYVLPITSDASDLSIAISGGEGDADVYVRYNELPTVKQYGCRPYRDGNEESCIASNAIGGNYYVMIRGFEPYSGVTLLADYSDGSTPEPIPEDPSAPAPPPAPEEPAPEDPTAPEPPPPAPEEPAPEEPAPEEPAPEEPAPEEPSAPEPPAIPEEPAPEEPAPEEPAPEEPSAPEPPAIPEEPAPEEPAPEEPAPEEPAPEEPAPEEPAPEEPAPEEPAPPGDDSACLNPGVQQELLDAHNAARAQARSCGADNFAAAAPLEWSCALAEAAEVHSSDMATNNFFLHTGSDGSSAGQRISAQGYQWRMWGENIAAGYVTVEAAMKGWLDSPGHCRNIMNPNATELGAAAVADGGADYSTYWTAVFARPQ